ADAAGTDPAAGTSGSEAEPELTAAVIAQEQDWSAAEALATAGSSAPLLSLDHLVKNFSVTARAVLQRKVGEGSAVADVSFAIPRGQTFGLGGESGCGKTTIGRLIVGLEKATSGAIVFDGEDLTKLSTLERRRRASKVQLMFQDSYAAMDPRMRVSDI